MPSARYQQRLDSWWQSQRELEFEQDDFYEVGGFVRIPFADSVLSQEPARQGLARAVTNRMLDDKYRPRSFEELADESDSA